MNTDIRTSFCPVGTIYSVTRKRDRRMHRTFYTAARLYDAFIFVLQGSCVLGFDGGETITVRRGELLYLPKGIAYSFRPLEDYEPIFCNFEFAEPVQRCYLLCAPADAAETEKLFRQLHGAFRPEPAAICENMTLLYRIYKQFLPGKEGAYLPASAAGKVAAAKEYLQTNCHNAALSIAKLAQNAELSEVYFRKLFQGQYGMTPSRFLMTARLERAKTLLREPFLSLEECALQSGFSSLSYFCRVFRQEVGTTPAKYRKQT